MDFLLSYSTLTKYAEKTVLGGMGTQGASLVLI